MGMINSTKVAFAYAHRAVHLSFGISLGRMERRVQMEVADCIESEVFFVSRFLGVN